MYVCIHVFVCMYVCMYVYIFFEVMLMSGIDGIKCCLEDCMYVCMHKNFLILDDADDAKYADKNTIYNNTEISKTSSIQDSSQKHFQ